MNQTPDQVPPIPQWDRLLEGQTAVVTGGGDGIGRAIALLFAQHGAAVEVAEIDAQRADTIRTELAAANLEARVHEVDVTDDAALSDFTQSVLDHRGTVQILVNNVGDYRPLIRFHDSTPDSWEEMYRKNLRHVIAASRAFLPSMMEARHGVIVNLHSVEGTRGFPGEPVYAAMKSAVTHFTTSLAAGYGRFGIRANGIGPDLIQTSQVDYLTGHEDNDHLWESWAPVGRVGWPEDVARTALFLASPLSAFVTGHNVPVDGGSLAQSGWFWSPEAKRFVNRPTGL